jgi:hypothetical protein
MDKVDGAQQSWRVSRQGDQSYLYLYFCVHVGIVLYQMMHIHIELLYLLILAICGSAEE